MDEMKALSDVFNLRPEMFMQGMRSLENVRQSDQQKLQQNELANQQQTLANQFAQENNPIRINQARFGLMKDRAMYPGDLAESQAKITKAENAGNYTPEQVPAVLTQAAAYAGSAGAQTPGIHGAMRKMLKNAYIPEIMDQWTPQQFAQNLPKMLQSYTANLPKNDQAMRLQESKDAAARDREQMKTDRAESVARIAASAKKNAVAKAPKDPKSLGEYAASLFKQADALMAPGASEEDMARASALTEMANEYQRRFEQLKINTTPGVVNPGIDVTQFKNKDGSPRFPAKPIPQPTQPKQAGPAPLDAAGKAEYDAWKKANGLE